MTQPFEDVATGWVKQALLAQTSINFEGGKMGVFSKMITSVNDRGSNIRLPGA